MQRALYHVSALWPIRFEWTNIQRRHRPRPQRRLGNSAKFCLPCATNLQKVPRNVFKKHLLLGEVLWWSIRIPVSLVEVPPSPRLSLAHIITHIICHPRHVMLPKEIAKLVPRNRLMSENEWRRLGVQQSQGWCHYMLHSPGVRFVLYIHMYILYTAYAHDCHYMVSPSSSSSHTHTHTRAPHFTLQKAYHGSWSSTKSKSGIRWLQIKTTHVVLAMASAWNSSLSTHIVFVPVSLCCSINMRIIVSLLHIFTCVLIKVY